MSDKNDNASDSNTSDEVLFTAENEGTSSSGVKLTSPTDTIFKETNSEQTNPEETTPEETTPEISESTSTSEAQLTSSKYTTEEETTASNSLPICILISIKLIKKKLFIIFFNIIYARFYQFDKSNRCKSNDSIDLH